MSVPRLDWMKFFVHDWINSEHVGMMSDAEIGQYLMLLCAAWALGQDCTLPLDDRFLANKAHCQQLSSRVANQFQKTEDGLRIYNARQQGIWREQQRQFAAFSERGKRGRDKQLATPSGPSTGSVRQAAGSMPAATRANRIDVNGMEKEKNSSNGTYNGQRQETTTSSFPEQSIASSNGNSKAIGVTLAPEEELDWEFIPASKRLARRFHSELPQENKDSAPPNWEKLWADDFAKIKDEESTIAEVISFASRKIDRKTNQRFYVRGLSFIKNYAKLKSDMLKLQNAKLKKLVQPPRTLMTPKEAAASLPCQHGIIPRADCMDCYMARL
jgi:uncharacterized protein YdaU (DUF1376 family)